MTPGTITVVEGGLQTTVQDLGGRTGLWHVGVPPSGAWDDLSFALANRAVGNGLSAAGLEAVVRGPVLRFASRAMICVTGAATTATVDGHPVTPGRVTVVPPGGVLDIGECGVPGMRGYLAVAGGLDVPRILGSRATFLLGKFGGHKGRALQAGDELTIGRAENLNAPVDVTASLPELTAAWTLRVLPGPHGAPEHLTAEGVAALWTTRWVVDHRADRTGVRLVGPTPEWARTDGGEAGLHPSNIHDSAYPVGGIMLSGDTPVIVGPDGPSLGGFVVPCVVVRADRWKLAQLRAGDTVVLEPVSEDEAAALNGQREALLASTSADSPAFESTSEPPCEPAVSTRADRRLLAALSGDAHRPDLAVLRAGDHHVLLEAGLPKLDLTVRMWVHLLAEALRERAVPAVREIVEGVRSVLVQADPSVLAPSQLATLLLELAEKVPDPSDVVLDVREVTMPLALDHPLAHEAMRRYQRSVRPNAPWCPDNVEFIRRINDLDSRTEVFDVVQEATYLVVGLGDVYLGAPVAVPIDPRHRLVTTKYDPARTWTPENAVGIGGVYLCIYGMEGPGGYQLVGRTVPVWRMTALEHDGQPWLLRQFDRVRFVPVSAEELATLRAEVAAGVRDLDVRPATFSLSEIAEFEVTLPDEIAAFRSKREAAFAAERARWAEAAVT